MKYKQTPPIQWLPVFEAAARSLSFKKAAEELCVSPPAVSQQIKAFENWLEIDLFDRRGRRLALTEAGSYYFDVASKVLQTHNQGYVEFKRRLNRTSFNVSTSLFVAQELLLHNYLSFTDSFPKTELRIEARMSLADFEHEPIDGAIRFGTGDWPGCSSRKLCDIYMAPVCSPDYLQKNPVRDLADLKSQRLISTSSSLDDWGELESLRNATRDRTEPPLVFDSYMTALKAASEGVGIALGLFPVTNNWITKGLLCCPLTVPMKSSYGYWFCAPENNTHPITDAFFLWIEALFDDIPPVRNLNPLEKC